MKSFKLHYNEKLSWMIEKEEGLRVWRRESNLGRVPMIIKCGRKVIR